MNKRQSTSMAVENMKKRKNMNELEEMNKEILDAKLKDFEFEKKEFMKKLDFKEDKLLKKKEKIKNLRVLIEELREKLNYFNDKDLQSMSLLKMKENQL